MEKTWIVHTIETKKNPTGDPAIVKAQTKLEAKNKYLDEKMTIWYKSFPKIDLEDQRKLDVDLLWATDLGKVKPLTEIK